MRWMLFVLALPLWAQNALYDWPTIRGQLAIGAYFRRCGWRGQGLESERRH